MKLQTKITLLFAGCISLVCSAAMLFVALQSAWFSRNMGARLNTQLIESKAAEASSWMVQRIDELRIISRTNAVMAMNMDEVRPFIDRLNDEFSAIYGNRYGTFAAGGLDGLGYVTSQQTIDVSGRAYFTKLVAEGTEYEISTPVFSKTDGAPIVLICYAVKDEAGQQVGFVNGAISLAKLTDLAGEIDFYGGSSFIADAEGNLYTNVSQGVEKEELTAVLQNMPKEAGESPRDISLSSYGIDKQVFFTPIGSTGGWYLCTLAEHTALFAESRTLLASIGFIWGVLLLVSLLLSVWVARFISRPVRKLSLAMQQVEQGDLTAAVQPRGTDETAQMATQFNHMVAQIRQLLQSVQKEQKERYKTQFRVLQNQINPHFLYNTLDTLQWKAADYEDEELVELIGALSGFFRISLSEGKDFIPLSREVEHVRHYLTIQQYRYADVLTSNVDLPHGMENYMVSRLILQPIVENAIYHGIKPKLTPGSLRVTGKEEKDHIEIRVEDDGVGMTPKQLAAVRQAMEGDNAAKSVGLCNVQQRIRLIYGEEYGLEIFSQSEKGTRVTVRLPKIKEGEEPGAQSGYLR